MGEMITLTTADGFSLSAYRAAPDGKPRAAVVVLQEIFGVNHHIRSVADEYAGEGYLAIAPALFDRVERNVELGYTGTDMPQAMALIGKVDMSKTLVDIQAAIDAVKGSGKVGIVGYCWGGSMAFAAACHLSGVTAAVGYYGGNIAKMLHDKPNVPVILHFGERDDHIPMRDVHTIKETFPHVPVYVYPAGHGFNCDERGSYDEKSAELARTRTMAFFSQHLL